jgi:hypothetical protein
VIDRLQNQSVPYRRIDDVDDVRRVVDDEHADAATASTTLTTEAAARTHVII